MNPFIEKNLAILCFLFETYSFRFEIINLGIKLLKCLVQLMDESFPLRYFEKIMKTSLLMFQSNPTQNAAILKIIGMMVNIQDSPQGKQICHAWLQKNYNNYIKLIMGLISKTEDPDIIRYFLFVEVKILQFNEKYLLTHPQFETIMNGLKVSLIKITEY